MPILPLLFAPSIPLHRLALAARITSRHAANCDPLFSIGRQRRVCTVASTGSRQTSDRGFTLLRNDLSRLAGLVRGDLSPILDRSYSLPRYDPIAISEYYDARPFSALIRVTSVGIPFLLWLFRVRKLDRWRGLDGDRDIAAKRAEELRQLLTWAGPTYLKIGQAVGNRPDLVGVVYSNELQKLVDDVGTFDSNIAVAMVKEELQIDSLEDLFSEFNVDAVASASLGQVHRARLTTGEEVAVKVQRPTVERDAALDVYVLRRVAAYAKKRFKLRSDLVGIVDEFATRLWEELDYVNEADNCENFDRLYAKDNDDVYVPKVYRDYTTKRVLCMEWIEGQKAPWLPKAEAERLIGIGVQCSLKQLLDKGFVHSDPHLGNLLRTTDGKLCYLDFGMCVNVEQRVRSDLVAAIVRLINRDYTNLAQDFVRLGFLPPGADIEPLIPLLEQAFGDASTGSSLSDLSFSKLADNLSSLAFKTPVRIPAFFTLIIRSLTILEGIALQADASFKIIDEAYPYVVYRVLTDDNPAFQSALEGVLVDSNSGRIRWNRLESILKTRSSSVKNVTQNGVDTSIAVTEDKSSRMSSGSFNRVVDFALSERGLFLRKALNQELTDAADAAQLALMSRFSRATNGLFPPPVEEADMDRLEDAITLAKVLRGRAPQLFAFEQNGPGGRTSQERRRQEKLKRELLETSRTVVGNLAERNTRRLLRKAIDVLLGGDRIRKI